MLTGETRMSAVWAKVIRVDAVVEDADACWIQTACDETLGDSP
jgi:hypothetical protein